MDEEKIKKIYSEPPRPTYIVCGTIFLGIAGFLWPSLHDYVGFMEKLLFCFSLLLAWFIYFSIYCQSNKTKIYIAYTEMEKRANTQSNLREQAESELNELKNTKLNDLIELALPTILAKIEEEKQNEKQ